jgi:polyphosphate:AMP phosphotransferase
MLEKLDLSKRSDDKEFDKTLASFKEQLGPLQRELRDRNIPTMIVIEGWNASGITMVTHQILQSLDPRGFTLHATDSPTDEEQLRPFMWRFWLRIPHRGRIAIFARSWYSRTLAESTRKLGWKDRLKNRIDAINNFERQLCDDGTIIIKFFLHISREEQKVRLTEREKNPLTAWLVTPSIWDFHHRYDDYFPVIDDIIARTDTKHAPWTLVEATDRRYAILRVYSTILKTLGKRIAALDAGKNKEPMAEIVRPAKHRVKRRSAPKASYTKEDCQDKLNTLQIEMLELHYTLFKRKIPIIIVYEGWDAAGKGGNITRTARYMNPLGYDVIPISAPNDHEKDHHYLWRFIRHYPRAGHIAIFDRSWYGRVLVERVEGYCTEPQWQRSYQEINEMEEDYVESSGGGLIKFWLEISKEEQLRRFHQREKDPLKQYKITKEDWRNREKWDLYNEAVDEMLARTNTPHAPWAVIESDNKWYARVRTLRAIVNYCNSLL